MADVSPVKKLLLSRKSFLLTLAGLVGLAIPVANYFRNKKKTTPIPGKIMGASHHTGHMLRGGKMPEPTVVSETDVLIIGAGITGMAAGRWLKKNNGPSFRILELDKISGGNSAFGENSLSAYPWGAHYLPVPNNSNDDLLDFLKEHDVITGYENELPIYNDYYLCHDPEERLYIHGHWQEGLIPSFGIPEKEQQQIKSFLQKMETYRQAKGNDGKDAFTIPVDHSSQDQAYKILDQKNFKAYLIEHGFDAPSLLWYVDYCCRDDYGTTAEETSAWAGIHYFASRKGKAVNADYSDVLTWPNGNGWLAERLKESCKENIETGKLVYGISVKENKVHATVYNTLTHATETIVAKKCILATPQFVNHRILKAERNLSYDAFTYAPWMVANLHVKGNLSKGGVPLCWDNVLYNQASLGYVNAGHQKLSVHSPEQMLTFYYPLTAQSPVEARKAALEKTHAQWMEEIIKELKPAHQNIESSILSADVWLWGHGMIRPTPGFIWGNDRLKAQQSYKDQLFFAHSDLSGISIFEEAFHHGIKAAKEVLRTNA